jgi:hypothetical protein
MQIVADIIIWMSGIGAGTAIGWTLSQTRGVR